LRGKFITLEGVDGAGKSTLVPWVAARLRRAGREIIVTREPGGTPLAEKLRALVLAESMDPLSETLLMFAARFDHVQKVIQPALERGAWVICDRFTDATLAYQGYGRGLSLGIIRSLHELEVLSLQPDLTLIFDIEARDALARARSRDAATRPDETRFEQEDLAFHERVRRGYLEIARREAGRCVVVDASGSIEEVHGRVVTALAALAPAGGGTP